MKNKVIRALANEGRINIIVAKTTQLSEIARQKHDMWPTATATLSRVMSMASIMSVQLKNTKEKISIHINGGGELGTIIVDANQKGDIRGFVANPHVHYQYNDTKKLAVGIAVGKNGILTVTKDLGLKEKFSGQVALQTGEIGEDFAYYYAVSEQIPSLVALGCLVDVDNSVIASGGILIQLLPDATEEDIVYCEKIATELGNVSSIFKNQEPEDVIKKLFSNAQLLEEKEVRFQCSCEDATMKRALLTLTKQERLQLIEEDHGAEMTCHFCNKKYYFDEKALIELEQFVEKFGSEVEN